MSDMLPAMVFLDGSAAKQIREVKNLTQLYVSKVVGVTTDTISRWENNRYPTIKRENALKLAEALEVEVDQILASTLVDSDADTHSGSKRSRFFPLMLGGALVILLLIVVLFFPHAEVNPVPDLQVARKLPNYAPPGGTIPVRVLINSDIPEGGFILREYFPKGWKLVQAAPPASSLDNVNGIARWIIKAGDHRQRIVYMLQVDSQAKADDHLTFRGEVIVSNADRQSKVEVDGMERITVAPVVWADSNGDFVIDDAEMLQASYTVDEMEGVLIDWPMLERLWDAGRYAWNDEKHNFVPVRK